MVASCNEKLGQLHPRFDAQADPSKPSISNNSNLRILQINVFTRKYRISFAQ